MMKEKYIIKDQYQIYINERLDVFISNVLEISRNQAQHLIEKGKVKVNNKTKSKHYKLRKEDKVEVEETKSQQPKIDKNILKKIKIIYTCDSYLVVSKPSGLPVHPDSKYSLQDTLVGYLLERFPEISEIGEENRPGIVHRLDMQVSGVMVVARSFEMFEYLKNQFKNRTVKKVYKALVFGKISKEEDCIKTPLARRKDGFMKASPEGRKAETCFIKEKEYQHFTLLRVYPKTGRMHQIRVHLNFYGHPIVGEKVYISKKYKKSKFSSLLARLFLHGWKIGFYNLDGDWVEYISELDIELKKFLKQLR